ncbi:hypothetical protein Dimus_039324 [Dionaea muscipula]
MAEELPILICAARLNSLPGVPITSIKEATSILTHDVVRDMKFVFPCPSYYYYSLPSANDTAMSLVDQDTLMVPFDHFTQGLRFPLHWFVVHLLAFHDMRPVQWTPKLIDFIINFIVMCKKRGEVSDLAIFDVCYEFQEEPANTGYFVIKPCSGYKLVREMPEVPVIWKRKFIRVWSDAWPSGSFTLPGEPELESWIILVDGISEQLARLLRSFLVISPRNPRYTQVVTLNTLEQCGIAIVPHRKNMLVQCFDLYGIIGVKERRVARQNWLARKRAARQYAELIAAGPHGEDQSDSDYPFDTESKSD